jgi:hypothetical protein
LSFVDQLLGKMQAPGIRDSAGRRSQMLQKQPPEVTRSHSKALRKSFNSTFLQPGLGN